MIHVMIPLRMTKSKPQNVLSLEKIIGKPFCEVLFAMWCGVSSSHFFLASYSLERFSNNFRMNFVKFAEK
jgi:hypothetical protein